MFFEFVYWKLFDHCILVFVSLEVMQYDLANFIAALPGWLVDFYNSPFVLALKIFFGIYVAVLFVDIVLLLILRGVSGNIRTGLRGMDMPTTSVKKMRNRWSKILQRLEIDNLSQHKVAIIEADALADDILRGIGYDGNNMGERLMHIKPEQLDGLEDLKRAHQIRNRIVHELDFQIDHKEAHEVLKIYENFLKYLEFL